MNLSFAFGCACGAVASFVLVALAYRAVLRGVMNEQQDRVSALKAEREHWEAMANNYAHAYLAARERARGLPLGSLGAPMMKGTERAN